MKRAMTRRAADRGAAPVQPMVGAAAGRLRRLRLWLTVLFTATNTIGLVLFAPLVLDLDEQSRRSAQEAELRQVSSSVVRLIRTAGDAIDVGLVPEDPMYRRCPPFAIVSGDRSFPVYRNRGDCVRLDDRTLRRLAADAMSGGDATVVDTEAGDGRRLLAVVLPYAEAGRPYAGAVVAWTDFEDTIAAHQRLRWLVLAGCVVLIGGVAVLGHWLAGRAIRPAAAALEQQEVLLAETAHDLRTPVAALRALADAAAMDRNASVDLLPRTVRLAGRMGDIIDGLLIRARLAAGVEQLSMQPLWLDQLVAVAVEDTPTTDGASVSVITAPSKVMADRMLVERAIGNLLDNALRHGREPGQQAVVTVTVADGRVTVADRGPGVDPDLSDEEIFSRFTGTRGSSGLGLSIVRWVAEAHGGALSVHNAEEGGAIFEFRLPSVGGAEKGWASE